MKKHDFLKKYFSDKSFEDLLKMITGSEEEPENVKTIIKYIENMIESNAKDISYTQLRNVLQQVKNKEFESSGFANFYKVLPKLAYMEARPTVKTNGKKVISFIRQLASEVKSKEEYKSFIEIVDTIVAYHKLHGK